ncbi:MAG: hypothetical protein Q3Y27_07420, partial [Clostridia bacterium]|nr:hypothetical protein [Clostridia bacterium]
HYARLETDLTASIIIAAAKKTKKHVCALRRFPKGDRRRSSVFIALWSRPQTRNPLQQKSTIFLGNTRSKEQR